MGGLCAHPRQSQTCSGRGRSALSLSRRISLTAVLSSRCSVPSDVTLEFLLEAVFLIINQFHCGWMPSEKRGMCPKEEEDQQGPLEHLRMWNGSAVLFGNIQLLLACQHVLFVEFSTMNSIFTHTKWFWSNN